MRRRRNTLKRNLSRAKSKPAHRARSSTSCRLEGEENGRVVQEMYLRTAKIAVRPWRRITDNLIWPDSLPGLVSTLFPTSMFALGPESVYWIWGEGEEPVGKLIPLKCTDQYLGLLHIAVYCLDYCLDRTTQPPPMKIQNGNC